MFTADTTLERPVQRPVTTNPPRWTVQMSTTPTTHPWTVSDGVTINRTYENKSQAVRRARDLNMGRIGKKLTRILSE